MDRQHFNINLRPKVAYRSYQAAEDHALDDFDAYGRVPQIYQCPTCGYWHLGGTAVKEEP